MVRRPSMWRTIFFSMMNLDDTYQLSLLLTERCNLRCSYCYCDKRQQAVMSFDVARRAIDETVSAGCKKLRLLLMGGEPFMDFDLLRRVVEYARDHVENVHIKTVSNGTLIHGEVQQWLYENRDSVFVSVSLDGDRENHNRNRCGSYDKIDFPFFIRTYGKEAEASMVASTENLDSLCHNVQHVEGLGFNVKCVLADDDNWDAERDCPRLAEQLDRLIQYYLTHPERKPFTVLRESLGNVNTQMNIGHCRPFVNMHCVAPDGQRYACHRCTPYYNNGAWQILETDTVSSDGGIMESCASCVARNVCCVCPALVHSLRNNKPMAATMCRLFRVVHRANAAFVAQLFLSHPEHPYIKSMQHPAEMIDGARSILTHLAL